MRLFECQQGPNDMMPELKKPLGSKAYGSIPHLPASRMGPGDHHCSPGQSDIATVKARDKHDKIIVQEKLDGSCVSVAMLNGQLIALGRAGYVAESSNYEQHKMFARWVKKNEERFKKVLVEGERICGEWLVQAHGTKYDLTNREPFVPFDIFRNGQRILVEELYALAGPYFHLPPLISQGMPCSIEVALKAIETSKYGAIDPVEGCVWRIERKGKVDFLCKYVRPDKVDGTYLKDPEGNQQHVWNWNE